MIMSAITKILFEEKYNSDAIQLTYLKICYQQYNLTLF